MLMGELDVMDELDFLLKIERMKVKDIGLVPAKDPSMLELDNLLGNL